MIIDYSKSIDRKQVVTTVTDWGDKLEIGMLYFKYSLIDLPLGGTDLHARIILFCK
jgi:hypothetical protein